MSKHVMAEIALGAALLLCALFIGFDQYRKAVDNAKAEAKAEALQEAQKTTDAALQARDQEYKATLADYEARYQRLAKMTPQQIIQKAPEYVTLPKPIVIAGPETQTIPVTGSAIVPPEDVKPLAQAILDGSKCKVDLLKCQGDLGDWQQKYDLKDQEAKQWEKSAKGGSWLARLGKNTLKIGIGVGIGYMLHR
jgi:hypothetical protein